MTLRDGRLRALVASVVVVAIGYLVLALLSGWDEVVSAVATAGAGPLLVASVLSLVNYGLRFARWEFFLRWQGQRVPWRESLRIYVAGFALTTTPGKLGEMVRTPLLSRLGVPAGASLAAFLGERLSDVIAVLLLTLVAAGSWSDFQRPLLMASAGLAVLLIVVLPVLRRLAARAPVASGSRLRAALATLQGLGSCSSSVPLTVGLLLGLLAWFAEAYAFAYLLVSLGHDVGIGRAAFVYGFSLLVGAATFLPGGLGSTEATMVGLLLLLGLDAPVAAVATVLIRILTLWLAVLLGMLAMSMRPLAAPEPA